VRRAARGCYGISAIGTSSTLWPCWSTMATNQPS
jgi:hypothetical protein